MNSLSEFLLNPFKRKPKNKDRELFGTLGLRMIAMSLDAVLLIMLMLPFQQWLMATVFPGSSSYEVMAQASQLLGAATLNHITWAEAYRQMNELGIIKKQIFDYVVQSIFCGVVIVYVMNRWHTTPAMSLVGLGIADAETGAKPGLKQYIWRYIGIMFSAILMGIPFIWIAFDKKRQAPHDKMGRTVVFKIPSLPKRLYRKRSFHEEMTAASAEYYKRYLAPPHETETASSEG
jgi:hypothetical protein